MMDRAYFHEGYCEAIQRKDRKDDHKKTTAIMFFVNTVVILILSVIVFAICFVSGLLMKFFVF